MTTPQQTLIIGGGISGLACAWRLQQAGEPVLLLEESDRVGGAIQSIERGGFIFELGPQSVLSNAALLELAAGVGLESELLRADNRAPRFVLVDGRLQRVPMAPPSLLTTSLLSTRTKLRLLTEPFRKTTPPEPDESVADFVRRKFGAELLDRLVAPFVSGVYAGDPERLSLRSAFSSVYEWEKTHGSVLKGAMKSRPPKDQPRPGLCSFREGLAALPRAIAHSLGTSLRMQCHVTALCRAESGGFEVAFERGGRSESVGAAKLVVATSALAAGELLKELSATLAANLARIPYAAVAVVSVGYRREQVKHPLEGFGFLVPRKEGLNVLGTVWSSSLFPGRAPAGMVCVASFVGGATNPTIVEKSEEEIFQIVEPEVARMLHIEGPPVERIVRRYPYALPQYNLGHSEILREARAELARFPGLFLTGNFLEGPSVANCVEQAFRTADATLRFRAGQKEGAARA